MAPVLVLTHGDGASLRNLPKPSTNSFYRRPFKHTSSLNVPCRLLPPHSTNVLLSRFFRPSLLRVRSFQGEDADNFEVTEESLDGQNKGANEKIGNQKNNLSAEGNSFLLILAIAVGVAAIITITSIGLKWPSVGSFFGVQSLAESSTSSALASPPVGFTFKAFGYRIILPEYAPGWIYFWLLMAAGCGLFISEEALNIWVGITLSRMLSVDGTWQSFVESFSRNAPYIMSTVFWVYWGVCISDMIPFYLGKLFRESGATDDICSKLGIGEEKVSSITHTVQQYGNLAGIVERFSLGVRNPTAFLAGTLGISPEFFFAGVCCGGLITLPLQLGIGFLLRERPVVALATVATVVGIWTIFPYAVAALTALFLYVRRRRST
ncbi:hypothetical protein P3X46_017923 [Hevea brasiliensis]|uniref:Uncharacterized protein n=1 Tax=Hevea brasiliensis TaxID=3981 RepID=A0ABQ9LP65_HEVBR|nr:uncharacterized protein LOC110643675 isoform X3 [Hevea brasiliensis]KAJ9169769.1 hypothetical protein P3X46_017923 [Hevea brasiliensis]